MGRLSPINTSLAMSHLNPLINIFISFLSIIATTKVYCAKDFNLVENSLTFISSCLSLSYFFALTYYNQLPKTPSQKPL